MERTYMVWKEVREHSAPTAWASMLKRRKIPKSALDSEDQWRLAEKRRETIWKATHIMERETGVVRVRKAMMRL